MPKSTAPVPVLPNELLEAVIDNFDAATSPDRITLVNCSYTNRDLNASCQTRLFHQVTVVLKAYVDTTAGTALFYEDEKTNGRKFLDLLNGSPHVAQYVQNVEVVTEGRHYLRPKSNTPSHALSPDPAFALYSILPRLSNLTTFSLRASASGTLKWSTLEHRIRGFFTDIIQRLPAVDLSVLSGIPDFIFAGCVALKELHISRGYPGNASHTNAVLEDSGRRPRLAFLELTYFNEAVLRPVYQTDTLDPFFSPASGPFDLTGVRSLKMYTWAPALASVIDLCSKSLQRLELRVYPYPDAVQHFSYGSEAPVSQPRLSPIDLSGLLNLRSLTFQAAIDTRSWQFLRAGQSGYYTDIPLLSLFFETLPRVRNTPILKTTLVINIFDVPEGRLGSIAWPYLIKMFVGNGQWAAVGVRIDIHFQMLVKSKAKQVIGFSSLMRNILDRDEYLGKMLREGLIQVYF